MKGNVIKIKSYDFAIKVIETYKVLVFGKKEYVLSKQLLRSGTSIGALVREAEYAESKRDFVHKLSIALKEANETEYWLDLLRETKYLESKDYTTLKGAQIEIIKLLIKIIKTSKRRMNKE